MSESLIVCGLLPIERELLKYKGSCKGCLWNDSFVEKGEFFQFCGKRNCVLDFEESSCDDWLLDTR